MTLDARFTRTEKHLKVLTFLTLATPLVSLILQAVAA